MNLVQIRINVGGNTKLRVAALQCRGESSRRIRLQDTTEWAKLSRRFGSGGRGICLASPSGKKDSRLTAVAPLIRVIPTVIVTVTNLIQLYAVGCSNTLPLPTGAGAAGCGRIRWFRIVGEVGIGWSAYMSEIWTGFEISGSPLVRSHENDRGLVKTSTAAQ